MSIVQIQTAFSQANYQKITPTFSNMHRHSITLHTLVCFSLRDFCSYYCSLHKVDTKQWTNKWGNSTPFHFRENLHIFDLCPLHHISTYSGAYEQPQWHTSEMIYRYMATRKHTHIHTSSNAVTLVWGSLRLAPTIYTEWMRGEPEMGLHPILW